MKLLVTFIVVIYLLTSPQAALAFFHGDAPGVGPGPIQGTLKEEILGTGQQAVAVGLGIEAIEAADIRVYALRIFKGILSFVGLVLIAMILYGGFLYMTSGGSEEKIGTAKKIISRAAVGTAIILSSYAITVFISRRMIRIIFDQIHTQVQSCGTQTGFATCCNEWNAYQAALTSVPSLTQGASGIAEQYEQDTQRTRELYGRWQECFDRAQESLPEFLR